MAKNGQTLQLRKSLVQIVNGQCQTLFHSTLRPFATRCSIIKFFSSE